MASESVVSVIAKCGQTLTEKTKVTHLCLIFSFVENLLSEVVVDLHKFSFFSKSVFVFQHFVYKQYSEPWNVQNQNQSIK